MKIETIETVERKRESYTLVNRRKLVFSSIKKQKGITIVALVILLVLAGIALLALEENGLIGKVNQAKKAQIKDEMKEELTSAISELQTEKEGRATLDDITQEWANNILEEYNPTITNDASISGKKITMQKSGITGKYIIDENLNITEIEENISSIEFSYDIYERIDNKVKILIHVQDKENGLARIEFPDGDAIIVEANKKEEKAIDYQVEIGTEYKIKIISENGATNEKTILITDYWHNITKNLGENIEIDNIAIKAEYNKPYQATIIAEEGYIIDTLTITMGKIDITSSVINITEYREEGTINIPLVTGDIEIIATARKLEIQTTTPIINTSATATSSLGENTQTKGTTLYINFEATLEGTNCTIEPAVPYSVTTNGKYIFTITGTYNGKTISEEKEVIVKQYQGAQGVVQYEAGDWTEAEIQNLKTAGIYNLNASCEANAELNYTFGGFTNKESSDATNSNIVTSKDKSVKIGISNCVPQYDGWKILNSYEENGKMYVTKLIHAGCPENFVYSTYWKNKCAGMKVVNFLTSGLEYKEYATGKSRSWQMYIDDNQKDLIADTQDKDGNIVKDINIGRGGVTGSYYWTTLIHAGTSVTYGWSTLHFVEPSGRDIYYSCNSCMGIRPIVTLKSGVYIEKGSGIEEDKYILAMEQN